MKGRTIRNRPRGLNASNLPRRRFLRLAAGAAALPAVFHDASAQTYPARPITMIVPFAAGGAISVVAQVVAERMRRSLGRPFIIENVGGADGSIGAGRAARARPDGYTISIGTNGTNVLNGAFYSLSYDVLSDFAPVSPLSTSPVVLFARKSMPANDLPELIAWLKSNPNQASVAVAATGLRLLATLFGSATGTQSVLVPYRGIAPAYQDLTAEQIDLSFGAPDQLALVRAGSLKAYAVTSETRLAVAPDIPTFREVGLPALSFSNWQSAPMSRYRRRNIEGGIFFFTASVARIEETARLRAGSKSGNTLSPGGG